MVSNAPPTLVLSLTPEGALNVRANFDNKTLAVHVLAQALSKIASEMAAPPPPKPSDLLVSGVLTPRGLPLRNGQG